MEKVTGGFYLAPEDALRRFYAKSAHWLLGKERRRTAIILAFQEGYSEGYMAKRKEESK